MILNIRGISLYIINIGLLLAISIITINLFYSDILFYNTYSNKIAFDRLINLYELSRKWQWIGFVLIPIIVLLRVFYTSVVLYTGVIFADLKVRFGKIIKVALLADFVYILSGLAKLVILIFFKEISTLEDLQFQPFSVMELLDRHNVDQLFIYPLNLLNVFELAYILALAWLVYIILNKSKEGQPVKFMQSLKLVIASYGSSLLFWVAVNMFFTLNMT